MFLPANEQVLDTALAADLDAILDGVGEAIVQVDASWVVRYCNAAYLRSVGLTRERVIGRTPFEFLPGFERSIFYKTIEACRQSRTPVAHIGFSTALNRWLLARVFPCHDGMVMLANDATESVVKQQQLAERVLQDPLTSLGNKLALEQHLLDLLGREQPFALTVVGIDHFRKVNDAHGYAVGDMVLMELASSLQSATSPCEKLYRLSGEEFAVVHQADDIEPAQQASALLAAVRRPIVRDDARIVLDACVGWVQAPADGCQPELLLKRASLALRDAKRERSSRTAAYRTELELAARERDEIEAELRAAADGSQFLLHLQPKVELVTGSVCGAEALIRWANPRRGLVPPLAFLNVAEQIGMMASIDQWVLRSALRHGAQLRAAGLEVPLSINLSVDSLADRHLVARIGEALNDTGVPPDLLEIEVPEGALMHDVDAVVAVLEKLAGMGVRLSIDDFGTGYSSFAYLARLPVHTLKIDRSFVRNIGESANNRKIVKALIRMAHSLGLDVVAEGAEDERQLEWLARARCDAVQGYVFARPMPLAELQRFALERGTQRGPRPNPSTI